MICRFGTCRLDVPARQLLRDGQERPLQPKAFDLLRILIDARPQVLTKAEIMDLVWPDSYVAESNIAILIGDIRVAIGDSSREPRLIKTVFGIGYSFIGEVTESVSHRAVPLHGPAFILSIGPRRILVLQGVMTVGRDPTNDILLPDASVSRFHAQLHCGHGAVEVEDLASKNGTRVNGLRVEGRTLLAHGTEVVFGQVRAMIVAVENNDDPSTLTIEGV
jgi:DNA-binding winged helix-turn-helix (wHTH) protein